jgi:hypothetical protein
MQPIYNQVCVVLTIPLPGGEGYTNTVATAALVKRQDKLITTILN